jgi:hypothetical protein
LDRGQIICLWKNWEPAYDPTTTIKKNTGGTEKDMTRAHHEALLIIIQKREVTTVFPHTVGNLTPRSTGGHR